MTSQGSPHTPQGADPIGDASKLQFGGLDPILILSTHMDEQELMAIEEGLVASNAPLTYDVKEARVFIGKISQKRRAVLELRLRNVHTDAIASTSWSSRDVESSPSTASRFGPGRKRRHSSSNGHGTASEAVDLTGDSTTASESEEPQPDETRASDSRAREPSSSELKVGKDNDLVTVIRSDWLFDSIRSQQRLPFHDYLVYIGRRTERPAVSSNPPNQGLPRSTSDVQDYQMQSRGNRMDMILARARDEAKSPQPNQVSRKRFHGAVEQRDRESAYGSTTQTNRRFGLSTSDGVVPLLAQSTTEEDAEFARDIPEPPEWVRMGYKYACQRSSPADTPNRRFIGILKEIRMTRELTGDEIGIRAYSTAIATLSSYPYALTTPKEIVALPGCSDKIAAIFAEWKNNGETDVQAVREANSNARLRVLKSFYGIWGVGAATARDFYNRGWRDLDDVVEHGWNVISRVQQIGVKYYDEFEKKISREEVEQIRDVVHRHAQRVMGEAEGVRTTVVGGYRRGKVNSGDVDVMVSHLDDGRTHDAIDDIASSLYDESWITHSLGTTHSNSRRDEQTLPYKGPGAGRGFDTLDKVMVVWQDPRYSEKDAVDGRNPNVHRRVDIIISPWRTIGCAVLGWSAGKTFERDLRRYAKYVKKWKFDSSGIRDRETGEIVDVEAVGGRAETVEEAEHKVFAGLGLKYIEPWERCTG